jgi:hypothetical protein
VPAWDLASLELRTGRIAASVDDPAALARECRSFLEDGADRARRRGSGHPAGPAGWHDDRAPWVVGVSPRLLGVLETVLLRAAAQDPGRTLAAGQALWDSGVREMQHLASALLGSLPDSRAGLTAARWVATARDEASRAQLGRRGLVAWRGTEPEGFWACLEGWIRGRDPVQVGLALHAMAAAASSPSQQIPPRGLELLTVFHDSESAEVERARRQAMRAVIERQTAESVGLLLEQAGSAAGRRLARACLEWLPALQRERVRRALSSS